MKNELIPVKDLFDYINMREVEIQAHMGVMLSKAVESGLDLIELKERIPHGEFEKECEKHCVLKVTQRKDYMRIAKNQDKLPKSRSSGLSIVSALQYLSSPDEVRTLVNERLENGEEVTASEVRRLKLSNASLQKMSDESRLAQQEALKQKEEWRQQDLSKRDLLRKLEQERKAEKDELLKIIADQEVIFVPNDAAALDQIRKEFESKLEFAKSSEKKAHSDMLKLKHESKLMVSQGIQDGITAKLKDYEDAILDKQKQETALAGRIQYLKEQHEILEAQVSNRMEHKQAMEKFNDAALILGSAASVLLNDELPEFDDMHLWLAQLAKARTTIEYFENHIGELWTAKHP